MGFVDMRKPIHLDWLLLVVCPSGVIAYHGHRAHITRPQIFSTALLGALASHALFWLSVRNKLLHRHCDNMAVAQAAMQIDGGVWLTFVVLVASLMLWWQAWMVLDEAFRLKEQVEEERDKAMKELVEYAPPPQVYPPKASDYPYYQDILLYIISPASMAGLYNRRRWGMVAGFLGYFRVGVLMSPVVAKRVSAIYYARVRNHVLKATKVDIFQSPKDFDAIISFPTYDVTFSFLCITYSLYSIYKSRRESATKTAAKMQ